MRQLGGALGRPRPEHAALASVEAGYALWGVGIAATPELGAAAEARVGAVKEAVSRWTARHMVLNFADASRDPETFWSGEAYTRLRRLKNAIDPGDLFQSNHPVLPATKVA